ncbi:SDR family NAD(P)-dependent oxidoreductase [Rhodobacteraceae bacterium NNCM2]|nr:SDR family NAD(P)-dependent oxidoreductase [Coraliihabitans acroporae]
MTGHPILSPGKTALITGAGRGIGLAAAKRLSGMGMRVVLVDLPGPELEAAAREIPGAVAEPVDVADAAAMERLAARTGPVDFLMNNAVTRIGRGMDAPLSEWRAAMEVNFWGVVNGTRAFLPRMKDRDRGMIVNAGSKQGITNPPGHPVYNAAKAALKSYTESLQHDLRQETAHVTAHLLIPGWTMPEGPDKKPGAWSSDQVAAFMVEGLMRGDFYILCPDNDVTAEMDHRRIAWGAGDVIENRPPLSRWHPDFKARADKACS